MKAIFKRDQLEKKGDINFTLNCIVKLSEEESALIRKYKIHEWPIVEKTSDSSYKVFDLVQGIFLQHWKLSIIQEYEEKIVTMLKRIKSWCLVAEEYNGKEINLDI
jgi:hypothetical protein